MAENPDNLVLQLLRDMRADMQLLRADMQSLRSEMQSLRADVVSDMLLMRKELGDQIVGLRRAVVEYHSTVVGHGILISELEARVRRLEQNAGLSIGAH